VDLKSLNCPRHQAIVVLEHEQSESPSANRALAGHVCLGPACEHSVLVYTCTLPHTINPVNRGAPLRRSQPSGRRSFGEQIPLVMPTAPFGLADEVQALGSTSCVTENLSDAGMGIGIARIFADLVSRFFLHVFPTARLAHRYGVPHPMRKAAGRMCHCMPKGSWPHLLRRGPQRGRVTPRPNQIDQEPREVHRHFADSTSTNDPATGFDANVDASRPILAIGPRLRPPVI
jgi:hypothetical protein